MNIKNYECKLDLLKSMVWQDNDSINLQALIDAKNLWYQENHCNFWTDWFNDVFNLDTANPFGLRVWSDILDLPLYSTIIPDDPDYPNFGFDPTGLNFENGNFATDTNNNYRLTFEQIRTVLKLKWLQLTTNCVTPEINRSLANIFPAGDIFAIDTFNMTMTYVNVERLPKELFRIIKELDLLPRPAAVGINFIVFGGKKRFGFSPSSKNFDNGNFFTVEGTGRRRKVGFGVNKNNFNSTNFAE